MKHIEVVAAIFAKEVRYSPHSGDMANGKTGGSSLEERWK